MKKYLFIYLFLICNYFYNSEEYPYFTEEDLSNIVNGKDEHPVWEENLKNYEEILFFEENKILSDNSKKKELDEYCKALQVNIEDIKERQYDAFPLIDLIDDCKDIMFSGLKGRLKGLAVDFNVGQNFFYFVDAFSKMQKLTTFESRFNALYKDNARGEDEADKFVGVHGLPPYDHDTKLAYYFRRFIYLVVNSDDSNLMWCLVKWAILGRKGGNEIMSDYSLIRHSGFANLAHTIIGVAGRSDPGALSWTFVNSFLNLCCLASDKYPEAFGSKMMKMVEKINADLRVQKNNNRIMYYKLDFRDAILSNTSIVDNFFDLDDGIYYPAFVVEDSKVLYQGIGLINFILNGEMDFPIGCSFKNNFEFSDRNVLQILDSDCLLAPAAQLINILPMGDYNKSKAEHAGASQPLLDGTVMHEGELCGRIAIDVSIKDTLLRMLWPNGSVLQIRGDTVTKGSGMLCSGYNAEESPVGKLVGLMVERKNNPGAVDAEKKLPSLMDGHERFEGDVDGDDIIARICDSGAVGKINIINTNIWQNKYSDYTVYFMPTKKIMGKMPTEWLSNKISKNDDDGNEVFENVKTKEITIFPELAKGDIKGKIDVKSFWKYAEEEE